MSKIVYVKPSFEQQVSDKILFVAPSFVELECEDEKTHSDYILNISSEDVYSEKLAQCLRNRQEAYSKLNQDELRFDDVLNGTTVWIDTIKDIKERFPKPAPLEVKEEIPDSLNV